VTAFQVITADCLEAMRELAPGSVDLIATDPPYYKVKGEAWDNQWSDPSAFIAWIGELCQEWRRVLAPNGSLYVFAWPKMAARVEVEIARWFNVCASITWVKREGWQNKAKKEDLRTYFPQTERVIFAEQGETAGSILRAARLRVALSTNDIGRLFPSRTGGPTGAVRNWELGLNIPSRKQWEDMRSLLVLPNYDDAIRPFNATSDRPYTDVWTFPTVNAYAGKHPCEKPQAMLRHIVETSSRPSALVLDCFAGSGSMGEAALALGRRALLIERDPAWADKSRARCEAVGNPAQPDMFATLEA